MYFDNFELKKELTFERQRGIYNAHDLHMHIPLEMNILQANDARFRLLRRNYIGKPGDVFLFRPFEPHWNDSLDETKPIEWLMVLFSPSVVRLIPNGSKLLLPFYTDDVLPPLIPAESIYARNIHQVAERAMRAQEQGDSCWETIQFTAFLDILLNVHRYMEDQFAHHGDHAVNQGILDALQYILEHITEELDINEIQQLSGRRRSRFYRDFQAVVGVSPNVFINQLRMQIARHLITTTGMSITDIALECGYNSIQYFNKVFKLHYSVAPSSVRMESRCAGDMRKKQSGSR